MILGLGWRAAIFKLTPPLLGDAYIPTEKSTTG